MTATPGKRCRSWESRYDWFLPLLAKPLFSPAMIMVAAVVVAVALFFWKGGTPQNARIEGPIASWIIPDQWSVGSGDREGKPIITRFNTGLRILAGHASFNKQVGIAVPLTHPTDKGLPGSEEDVQLSELEDKIRQSFGGGNESLFAGVITTSGMREFVLYTSNEAGAVTKAKSLARETTHHQLQYIVNDGPEWNVFKAFVPQ